MLMSRTRARFLPLFSSTFLAAALLGAGVAAHAADGKASKFYEDALVRFEKKDVDGAIIQLKNALQIDKNMLPVQVLLGKALLKNGDVIGAEVALGEALRLGVNRAEVVVQLALAYVAQGKQKLLFEQQQFALAGLPPGIQLQLLLVRASASSDLGDIKGALKAVDDARAIDPKSSAAWLAEVPIRVRAGQIREATEAADRGMVLGPNSTDAWYQKGSIMHVVGNLRGALAAYDTALKADPENVEARVSRAGIYIDLGQIKEALSDVAELQRLSANEPRAAYIALCQHARRRRRVTHRLCGSHERRPRDDLRHHRRQLGGSQKQPTVGNFPQKRHRGFAADRPRGRMDAQPFVRV